MNPWVNICVACLARPPFDGSCKTIGIPHNDPDVCPLCGVGGPRNPVRGSEVALALRVNRKRWGSYQREHEANARLGVRENDVIWMCPGAGRNVYERIADGGRDRDQDECEFAVTDHDFWHGDDSKLDHECPWHPPVKVPT